MKVLTVLRLIHQTIKIHEDNELRRDPPSSLLSYGSFLQSYACFIVITNKHMDLATYFVRFYEAVAIGHLSDDAISRRNTQLHTNQTADLCTGDLSTLAYCNLPDLSPVLFCGKLQSGHICTSTWKLPAETTSVKAIDFDYGILECDTGWFGRWSSTFRKMCWLRLQGTNLIGCASAFSLEVP